MIDADHPPLERWADMADAASVLVLDAHLGGQPVALIGIESKPLTRHGFFPVDGPSQWTAGTLFPLSSKKTARAINAASGNRPLVILANLSGFDGSPESLRQLQLEYGAEIGRAVVNFDGPIVFCVVSRYHGGAFVVFSGTLNDNMEVAAVEGSYASVIGGAPAAAVVFAAEVRKRTAADPRVAACRPRSPRPRRAAPPTRRPRCGPSWRRPGRPCTRTSSGSSPTSSTPCTASSGPARWARCTPSSRRPRLRPYLIDAVRRGMERTLADARTATTVDDRPSVQRRAGCSARTRRGSEPARLRRQRLRGGDAAAHGGAAVLAGLGPGELGTGVGVPQALRRAARPLTASGCSWTSRRP